MFLHANFFLEHKKKPSFFQQKFLRSHQKRISINFRIKIAKADKANKNLNMSMWQQFTTIPDLSTFILFASKQKSIIYRLGLQSISGAALSIFSNEYHFGEVDVSGFNCMCAGIKKKFPTRMESIIMIGASRICFWRRWSAPATMQ